MGENLPPGSDSEDTSIKSPTSDKPYEERFAEAVLEWKKEGCHVMLGHKVGERCGAPPHGVTAHEMSDGLNVELLGDCARGHKNVWAFRATKHEMRDAMAAKMAEMNVKESTPAAEPADPQAAVERDPMVAVIRISKNLRTQEVKIDKWIPNNGFGIELAGTLLAHFFAELNHAAAVPQPIAVPDKGIIDPRTGKKVSFS